MIRYKTNMFTERYVFPFESFVNMIRYKTLDWASNTI